MLSSAICRAVPYNICNSKMVIISTHSFSAARLSSSTSYKPTLAMGIRSSGTLAQGVGRAGAMRWLQFKKGYFLAANILYDTFSSKFTMTDLCRYISKGIWIAMNVSLETSFRMSVRPVEKVFCLFALIVLVVSCFLCFLFWQKIHQAGSISQTTHVTWRAGNARCVFNLILFVPPLISTLSYLSHFWFQSILFVPLLIWLSLIDISLISGRGGP